MTTITRLDNWGNPKFYTPFDTQRQKAAQEKRERKKQQRADKKDEKSS